MSVSLAIACHAVQHNATGIDQREWNWTKQLEDAEDREHHGARFGRKGKQSERKGRNERTKTRLVSDNKVQSRFRARTWWMVGTCSPGLMSSESSRLRTQCDCGSTPTTRQPYAVDLCKSRDSGRQEQPAAQDCSQARRGVRDANERTAGQRAQHKNGAYMRVKPPSLRPTSSTSPSLPCGWADRHRTQSATGANQLKVRGHRTRGRTRGHPHHCMRCGQGHKQSGTQAANQRTDDELVPRWLRSASGRPAASRTPRGSWSRRAPAGCAPACRTAPQPRHKRWIESQPQDQSHVVHREYSTSVCRVTTKSQRLTWSEYTG